MPPALESLVWIAFWILVHVVLRTSPWLAGLGQRLGHRAYHLVAGTTITNCPLCGH